MADGQQTETIDSLAGRIKSKYPDYANVDNGELVNRIVTKYPDYGAMLQPAEAARLKGATAPMATSAPFAPNGLPPVPGAAPSPGMPMRPPLPTDLQSGPVPQEQAMQQSMGGPPQFVNVPQGQGQQFTQAGQQGYQTGGKIGAALVGVPEMAASPIGMAGTLAGGYAGGQGLRYGAQRAGLGQTAQDVAETIGNVAGVYAGGVTTEALKGATISGVKAIGNKIFMDNGELSPWAEALSHASPIPKSVLKRLLTTIRPETPEAPPPNVFPGATSSATPAGNAPLPTAAGANPAPQFVSQFSKPAVPEPEPTSVPLSQGPYANQYQAVLNAQRAAAREALKPQPPPTAEAVPLTQSPYANQYSAVVAAQRAAARAALKPQPPPEAPPPAMFPGATPSNVPSGNAPLPQVVPQGNVTPFGRPQIVSKFTPPEPSRIVEPGSTPPGQKVTYQSVPRKQLYKMALAGDIQAGLEIIRNPGDVELPPNFKYMIEETAKKIPWRNKPE